MSILSAGLPLVFRVHGVLIPALAQPDEESAEVMIRGLLNERQLKVLEEGREPGLLSTVSNT